jgi:hypothetical protein
VSKSGKKIDTIIISGNLDEVTLDLRFDKYSGVFHVEYPAGEWHESKDLTELKKTLKAVVVRNEQETWSRHIDVHYRAGVSDSGTSYYYADDHRQLKPGKLITELSLSFEVWDISSAKNPRGRKLSRIGVEHGKRKIPREDVGGGWFVAHTENHDPNGMRRVRDKELPYTEQRYQTLTAIRQGLRSLHDKFVELFKGDADEVALKLEGLDASRLLPAPKMRQLDVGSGIRCQFCEKRFPRAKWREVDTDEIKCPGCGRDYDPVLAQEGDD